MGFPRFRCRDEEAEPVKEMEKATDETGRRGTCGIMEAGCRNTFKKGRVKKFCRMRVRSGAAVRAERCPLG